MYWTLSTIVKRLFCIPPLSKIFWLSELDINFFTKVMIITCPNTNFACSKSFNKEVTVSNFSFLCYLFHSLYVSYQLLPFHTENPYFIRSLALSITWIESRRFSCTSLQSRFSLRSCFGYQHSARPRSYFGIQFSDNSKVLFCFIIILKQLFPHCDKKSTCQVAQVLVIFTCPWIFFTGTGHADKHLCQALTQIFKARGDAQIWAFVTGTLRFLCDLLNPCGPLV